jgi:hypothetical protein
MISRVRQSGRFSMMALVLGPGIWIALGSSAWAQAYTSPTPGMTGSVANPAGTVTTYPGTAPYSSNSYQAGTYPRTYMGATPAYTNQVMQGYTAVNPMATAMPPGSYAGTAGTPNATLYTPGYPSPYGTTGYYNTQPYGNVVQQRGFGYPYSYPGTPTYSSNDYQGGTYPRTYMRAIPAFTNQIMPGYTAVNPMATAMPPGSYAGTDYTTFYTPGYASSYGTTGYSATQPYGNVAQQGGYGYPDSANASGSGYGGPYNATAYAAPSVGVTYSSAYVAPAGSAANTVMPPQGRYLGIDEEPITDAIGQRGMKVTNVYPGTAAERAGLQVGDVIYASNGYLTEQRGNLAWISANAAPDTRLNMWVKTAKDRRERLLTAVLP